MRFSPAVVVAILAVAGTSLSLSASEPAKDAPTARAAAVDIKAALPWDPNLVRGTLENGLNYIIVKHPNPPGRAAVWVHVDTGSLNESEETRGIAHYLEHMAFNGSKNFPPNSVIDFFQSLGMQFGRDQNAFTSFDQTTYQLSLPDTKPETFERGFLFFGDVVGRLSLLPSEIEEERGIIIEERRTRAGASQRISEYVLPRLAPGSTIGNRLPIGTEETIKSVQKKHFEEYYGKYYTASNATLMVVADADPAMVIEQIKKSFGDLPTKPKGEWLPTGVKPSEGQRAIIATDPDLKKTGDVTLMRIDLPRPPATTVGAMRDELVDLIGQWAFNRRISALQAKGAVTFESGSASASELANAVRLVQIEASGQMNDWKKNLAEITTEIQRARLHGFTERELADARTELTSQAEQGVQREATLPAAALMNRLNRAVTDRESSMSAQQRLDLYKGLLPTITASEVSQRFTSLFDFKNFVVQVELPGDVAGGLPSEADAIKIAAEALNVKPEASSEEARATALLTDLPKGGKVLSTDTDSASQVTTAQLSNGLIVHHRFMDINKNDARVTISLAGGTINETAANRGVTDAAGLAWQTPATSTLSSTQIRDLMTGKKVRVGSGGGGFGPRGGGGGGSLDVQSLSISGNPADFETGFQLAYLLLTDPVIEASEFKRWQAQQEQSIAGRKVNAMGVLMETASDTMYPKDEVRTKPLTLEQVKALSLEQAQKWLKNFVTTAPIEVTIVGDIKAEDAMALVQKYLGSLPNREPISDKLFADRRQVKRPVGPLSVTKTVPSQTNQAMVLDGFFGPDQSNLRDSRLMQIAARALSTRMTKVIREEKQLVYSIGASFQPGRALPGYGVFQAAAPTDPAKADKLGPALEALYTDFAKTGPTEEELATIRKQFANLMDEQMKDTGFWMTRLSELKYRNQQIKDILELPAFYQNATGEEVREVFAKYYKPESTMRLVIIPEKAPASGDAKPAESK